MADPATQDNPVEGVDDGRPDWLPENFKSPEEFANSYKEAIRKITETSTANRNLEDAYMQQQAQIEELQSQQQQAPQYDAQTVQEQAYAAYEQDPLGFQARLAQEAANNAVNQLREEFQQQLGSQLNPQQEAIQQQAAMSATYELNQRYPDFQDYQGRIGDEIAANQHLVPAEHLLRPDLLAPDLERLYKELKYSDLEKQLEENQISAADQKLAAQTMSGGGGRPMPPDEAAAHWERVSKAVSPNYWENQPR